VRDEQLYAFVADARAGGASDVRRRTRWLQQQLREDAGFAGLCRELGSAGDLVDISLCDGRRHRGRLSGVGADALAMRTGDGVVVYIAIDAIVGMRAVAGDSGADGAGAPGADGGPELDEDQCFSDVLADLADRRIRVTIGTVGPLTCSGVLAAIGRDVVMFEDNQRYLRLQMITDVVIAP
jgi:hypothetical protein